MHLGVSFLAVILLLNVPSLSYLFIQDKGSAQVVKRKCPVCKEKLSESWKKTLCADCAKDVLRENSSGSGDLISTLKKELRSTFQAFRSTLEQSRPREEASGSQDPPRAKKTLSNPVVQDSSQVIPPGSGSEFEEEAESASKYKLSLEEVAGLLKVVYATLGIQEERKELSLYDQMYAGLGDTKSRVFPVHSLITEMIKKEWLEPEKKPFFSGSHKRRFPFEENPEAIWNKIPKLDTAFSQVSKSTDLTFEDMGLLKEPMDKRIELLLKITWQSVMNNLKPAMATTCVARNLEYWIGQLKSHISADSPKQEILDSFKTLTAGVSYIADASAESIRMTTRSATHD